MLCGCERLYFGAGQCIIIIITIRSSCEITDALHQNSLIKAPKELQPLCESTFLYMWLTCVHDIIPECHCQADKCLHLIYF